MIEGWSAESEKLMQVVHAAGGKRKYELVTPEELAKVSLNNNVYTMFQYILYIYIDHNIFCILYSIIY